MAWERWCTDDSRSVTARKTWTKTPTSTDLLCGLGILGESWNLPDTLPPHLRGRKWV